MSIIVLTFGALLAAFGAVVVVLPDVLASFLEAASTATLIYVGSGIRLLLGVALLFSASTSRAPRTLRVFGVLFIAGSVFGPLLGVERVRDYIEWWMALGPGFLRGWGVIAVAFGASLAYAVLPRSRAA